MPIRWRLTLWFSLVVLAIVVATNAAVYIQLSKYLMKEADSNLDVYTSRVHGTLLPSSIDQPLDYSVVHSQLPPINEFSSPGIYIQLIDSTGAAVVKSDNLVLGRESLPAAPSVAAAALAGKAARGTVTTADGTRLRILASPLYLQDKTLVLEVAQSLKTMDTTMARLRLEMLAGTVLAAALMALVGAFVLTRALQPVKRIAGIARDIEASADLSRRVGQTKTADEIGQLAATFDHMLEHLDAVFASQKNFIADASHELRSPLTVIRGNLDLIRRDPSKESLTESIKAIESETGRMSKIVNDLLLLAEVETENEPRQEIVRLIEIIKEEVSRARSLAPTRTIEAGQLDDLLVAGDSQRLRQLLSNLLDNAIKYTPDSGTITVSLLWDVGQARLNVSDTGQGIAKEHLPRLFDRFYRVDKARSRSLGSHGLGLAIAKGIAEQHGGRVTVSSEPGKGSTFTVFLPLMPGSLG